MAAGRRRLFGKQQAIKEIVTQASIKGMDSRLIKQLMQQKSYLSFNDSCLATDTQLEIILGCNGCKKVLASQTGQGSKVLVVRIIY